MSNLIPPLLSSSPPPIVGPLDDEEDDEFGDFGVASHSFECDDYSLPPSPEKSPVKLTQDGLDINSNNSKKATESPIQVEINKDFQDRRKSTDSDLNIKTNDSELETVSINCDIVTTVVNEEPIKDIAPNEDVDHLENTNEIEFTLEPTYNGILEEKVEILSESILNDEQQHLENNSEQLPLDIEEIKDTPEEPDFENSTSEEKILEESSIIKDLESDLKSDDDFGDFENHFGTEFEAQSIQEPQITPTEDDDDFGDFESPDTHFKSDDSDEFGDFSTPQHFESDQSIVLDLNVANAIEKSEAILKEIFPAIDKEVNVFHLIDHTEHNNVFKELKDVTDTNAVAYQWSKCNSQKMFLKALNIDMRNILYGPSWSSSMPRFASNLGMTPLEPTKSEILTPVPVANTPSPSNSSQKNDSDIPTAQFDWNGSGLINPLDSAPAETPTVSEEPQLQKKDFLPSAKTQSPILLEPQIQEPAVALPSDKQTILEPLSASILEPQKIVPELPTLEPQKVALEPPFSSSFNLEAQKISSEPAFSSSFDLEPQKIYLEPSLSSSFDLEPQKISSEPPFSSLFSLEPQKISPETVFNLEPQKIIPEPPFNFDFTSFNQNDLRSMFPPFQTPRMIPLRETHICENSEDSNPGWLQPTILTPDLPRKMQTPQIEDDEFDDFQMVLPETNILKETAINNTHSIASNSQKADSEDEFTDFHSSAPVVQSLQPLQPVPLEPLKPSIQHSSTHINWPDPGNLDFSSIELMYSRRKEPEIEVIKQKAPVEEDEWTDFVSVNPLKHMLPERTATPDLPLSVLNLNQVQPPKQAIPVITASGLVQTKLSSNHPFQMKPPVQSMFQNHNKRQPSIISNEFAEFSPQNDDEDWSDFVSSQPPVSNGLKNKSAVGWNNATPNIITNPAHYDAFKSYVPQQKRGAQGRRDIPSISAMPDLDFIAPKNRTSKK